MDIKPRPNHERYLQTLRDMGPAGRLKKACELTELTRQLMWAGIQQQFPDKSEVEQRRIYLERLLACHK